MDLKKQKLVKQPEAILYQTAHLKETKNLYFDNHKEYKFNAKIIEIFADFKNTNNRNIVILD